MKCLQDLPENLYKTFSTSISYFKVSLVIHAEPFEEKLKYNWLSPKDYFVISINNKNSFLYPCYKPIMYQLSSSN